MLTFLPDVADDFCTDSLWAELDELLKTCKDPEKKRSGTNILADFYVAQSLIGLESVTYFDFAWIKMNSKQSRESTPTG